MGAEDDGYRQLWPARHAVDLEAVRDDLTGVVQQALEPAHVSLWINEPG
jgi:hypothetical protein